MKGFLYPEKPHLRKHGPNGYASYKAYKPWLRDEFVFRCVYCLVRETWNPSGSAAFSTDHFVPQVIDPTKALDYDNLIYACMRCNSWKQDHKVLDPCEIPLKDHLRIEEDGTIRALTPEGAEHIEILELDDPIVTEYRSRLISTFKRLMSSSDEESQNLLKKWLGFPADLPNLAALKPPLGNKRPDGLKDSYFELRKLNSLPEVY